MCSLNDGMSTCMFWHMCQHDYNQQHDYCVYLPFDIDNLYVCLTAFFCVGKIKFDHIKFFRSVVYNGRIFFCIIFELPVFNALNSLQYWQQNYMERTETDEVFRLVWLRNLLLVLQFQLVSVWFLTLTLSLSSFEIRFNVFINNSEWMFFDDFWKYVTKFLEIRWKIADVLPFYRFQSEFFWIFADKRFYFS